MEWESIIRPHNPELFIIPSIKMRIMLDLSTKDSQSRVFYILCLVLLFARKYIFNKI